MHVALSEVLAPLRPIRENLEAICPDFRHHPAGKTFLVSAHLIGAKVQFRDRLTVPHCSPEPPGSAGLGEARLAGGGRYSTAESTQDVTVAQCSVGGWDTAQGTNRLPGREFPNLAGALSAGVSRAQPQVKDAYEHKMAALVERTAGVLHGDEADRQRRAWSIVALMVGSILISRGIPEQSESRIAPLDSALSTAAALIDADTDDRPR